MSHKLDQIVALAIDIASLMCHWCDAGNPVLERYCNGFPEYEHKAGLTYAACGAQKFRRSLYEAQVAHLKGR